MELALAPLQTYTDHHYRNAHHKVYGGIDTYYAPYLRMNNDGTIKAGPKLDILPENNLVPIYLRRTGETPFFLSNPQWANEPPTLFWSTTTPSELIPVVQSG